MFSPMRKIILRIILPHLEHLSFAELVEEKSNGRIMIDVVYDG
ncbi:hypothetical protein HMPREF0491_02153, partial [Lachnospiraceae oral taxon 107 str. F0167]